MAARSSWLSWWRSRDDHASVRRNRRISTATTTTVTRFCFYKDFSNRGDSYGDLSALPKYGHETCIAGATPVRRDTTVISWNKTVATAPGSVDLATVGPFTVRGYCSYDESVSATVAVTDVVSAQDGSSIQAGDGDTYSGDFDSGTDAQASHSAQGTSDEPAFDGGNSSFSVKTSDDTTAFVGFPSNGVYVNGAEGPVCSFTGYLVLEK